MPDTEFNSVEPVRLIPSDGAAPAPGDEIGLCLSGGTITWTSRRGEHETHYSFDRFDAPIYGILELGNFAAGFCGRLFAQAGHEVVRIEPPEPAPGWDIDGYRSSTWRAGDSRFQTKTAASGLPSTVKFTITASCEPS